MRKLVGVSEYITVEFINHIPIFPMSLVFTKQSDPTDLTGYVNLFLSRTGIRMPVRLGLYRHTYACTTRVRQAYVCLYDLG